MNKEIDLPCEKVVLAPDMLAKCLFDPTCVQVFHYWRDGQICLVLTRDLLQRYIKVLNRFGIPYSTIRRWILWFTAPEKVVYLAQELPAEISTVELCIKVAMLGQARFIIAASEALCDEKELTDVNQVRWLTPAGYIACREKELHNLRNSQK